MSLERVYFPYPGMSLGDFMSRDYAHEIGVFKPSEMVPGKKTYLSRSRISRGNVEGGGADPLEGIAASYGYESFSPEEHSLADQLEVISSSEFVLGIEGSAFHNVLLLEGDISTKFLALSRHRGGGGAFEHIKQAKGLRYETLNFLTSGRGTAHSSVNLDLEALEEAMRRTNGLASNLESIESRIERPSPIQTSYQTHLVNTQVVLTEVEEVIRDARLALKRNDGVRADRHLARLC